MRIIAVRDYERLCDIASAVIIDQIRAKADSVLGLATGATPIGVYERLVRRYEEGAADFSACVTFNLDEYIGLPPQSEASYAHYMHERFFSRVNIRPVNAYMPDVSSADIARACREYDGLIARAGGVDLQMLGLGHTGHIGFNEPRGSFIKNTHAVTLSDRTVQANARYFSSTSDTPRRAITMGIKTIMDAKRVMLLVSGKDKADILCRALIGDICPRLPASILQLHRDAVVIADEEALSLYARSPKQDMDVNISHI